MRFLFVVEASLLAMMILLAATAFSRAATSSLRTKSYSPIPVSDDLYRIGVGKQDITGPAAEVGMMGK